MNGGLVLRLDGLRPIGHPNARKITRLCFLVRGMFSRTNQLPGKENVMQTAQGIAKGDVLQRIAGIAFIVGGIATLVANALLPRAADPGIVAERLTAR